MADVISAKTDTGDEMPAFVTPDGTTRFLASLPGTINRMATPFLAEPSRMIDRKDWEAFDRSRRDLPILNQGQIGSCVAHGWISMVARAMQSANATPVPLARAMLYALINGGRDAGADPAAAVDALSQTGVCLESQLPYRFVTKNQLTPAMYEAAKRFRIQAEAVYSLDNFDEAVSAELLGFDAGFTARVAGDWNTPDADGCPPAYRGVGNHWMSFDNRLKRNTRGEWFLGAVQSWGNQWFGNGRCWMREAHFSNQNYLQMYAIRWGIQDLQDPNLPPVAS